MFSSNYFVILCFNLGKILLNLHNVNFIKCITVHDEVLNLRQIWASQQERGAMVGTNLLPRHRETAKSLDGSVQDI